MRKHPLIPMTIIFCTKCSAPAYRIDRKPRTQEGLITAPNVRNTDGSRKTTQEWWCKIGRHEFKPLLSAVGTWSWKFQLRDYEAWRRE